MSTSSKSKNTDCPEFAVRRETISSYFHPPLPSSTFYDLVNKGKIVPVKGIKGFYKLNDSLRRLGLREVPKIPMEPSARTSEDIIRLAFHAIDPDVFLPPSWLLDVEAIPSNDSDHATLLVEKHSESVMALGSYQEKNAYLQVVLDVNHLLKTDQTSDSGECLSGPVASEKHPWIYLDADPS